jgi:virulence factor Mce-like protein
MIKQAPSVGRILVMAAFTLSCFGILLFLWLSFGGPVPLRPEGYRVHVSFPEANQLAQEADVRISGVPVGRVKERDSDPRSGRTDAVLEIDDRYAPIPEDARAMLRQKTLLGETYVELAPGSRSARKVPDGGRLGRGRVAEAVQLDEIFRTFDPRTRQAFRTWLDQQGRAVSNRGRALNDALANLGPFADDLEDVLAILHRQEGATRGLVRGTGEVFGALSERPGQLRELISASNQAFRATAARDRELADTFRVLPTFLDEARLTTRRVTRFARAADPLVTQLRPAARELSPTLQGVNRLAPDLRGLMIDLGPLVRVARRGLPATEQLLDELRPLLERIDPWLRDVNPILDYLGLYKREIAAFFANDTAATQAVGVPPGSNTPVHYLRTTNPINPEVLAGYPTDRLSSNRSNPYVEPGGSGKIASGLEVFGSYLCQSAPPPPTLAEEIPKNLRDLIQQFAYTPQGPGGPACKEQRPLGNIIGQPGRFPRLERQP